MQGWEHRLIYMEISSPPGTQLTYVTGTSYLENHGAEEMRLNHENRTSFYGVSRFESPLPTSQ